MNAFRARDPLTQRIARTMREVERNPYSWFECVHKREPFNPVPYLCAAAAIGLLVVARYF